MCKFAVLRYAIKHTTIQFICIQIRSSQIQPLVSPTY